ncbi:MAG: hypothetical protein R3C20_02785 [Planctomycetaceae bacterium]
MPSKFLNDSVPSTLTEEQRKDDRLWMRHEQRTAPGTLKTKIGGLRFLYRLTCGLDGKVLERCGYLTLVSVHGGL